MLKHTKQNYVLHESRRPITRNTQSTVSNTGHFPNESTELLSTHSSHVLVCIQYRNVIVLHTFYFMKEREKSLRHRAVWKDKYLKSEMLLGEIKKGMYY